MPQRLFRNAIKALSQRRKAFIAIPKGENAEKIRLLSLQLHVFSAFRFLFGDF
jgi:hypothetical protein